MPTIFKSDGYRFYFYSNEHLPEHVHIEKGDKYAKIILDTLEIVDNYNLKQKELKRIVELIKENKHKIKGVWNEHFK